MEKVLAKKLIKYFKTLGIDVYTNTKARGHQGFFMKNRIDISKNVKEERLVPTLLHEFAHYIHNKIEPNMPKTGGSLEVLFDINSSLRANEESEAIQEKLLFGLLRRNSVSPRSDENSSHFTLHASLIEKELLAVTNFVDENSHCTKLLAHKEQLKKKIKYFEAQIKEDYPKFMRSVKFREFDKVIKKSKAKYLLKYDRVQLITPFLRRKEVFSIDNLERDFPELNPAFCAYIRMKSAQKKQARNSRRLNYYKKYYSKPTELFARFVEGLYIDEARVRAHAPHSTQRFLKLLEEGYFFELKNVLEMLQVQHQLATF